VRALLWAAVLFLPALPTGNDGRARLTWADVAPLSHRFETKGITADAFDAYLAGIRRSHADRVREGDLDHLVFYLLQSTRFTPLPPIEPALSAKAFVDALTPTEREAFLRQPESAAASVPPHVRSRVAALLRALDAPGEDARLRYFRALVNTAFGSARTRAERETAVVAEYLRAMKFLYEQEFVAPGSGSDAVAALYRRRGLSTDTAVEAGFMVHQGLAVLKSLEPERRIRRVLIVGPGLDLAPRTALDEPGPPESYQPWAVIDALLALGLSRIDDLQVVAADINPRVVEHLRRAHDAAPALTLTTEVRESPTVSLADEYRDYFRELGSSIGDVTRSAPNEGRLRKSVRVRPDVARTLRATELDIVTERLVSRFDLIVATNVLPYFDDVEVMLALVNVAAMLAPGGTLLHNEARTATLDAAATLGLAAEHSRHAVIASVRGAPAPLGDSVWLHRKSAPIH
jgi:hypothetical protein